MNWHEGIETNDLKRMNWNEWIDMKQLSRPNWAEWTTWLILEWIDMNELKRMTWNRWIETNELRWMNWNEAIDSNELNWMNEMTELTWMNWHEWIETNALKPMTWHEWIEMNDWTGMNCQKCFETLSFFLRFYVKPSARYSLVHILSTTSRIEARNRRNRDPPAATTDSHFTRKKSIGFCARDCFQPWIHTLPTAPTSQLLDDDVIGMMMWLTWWLRWWCGCHDGETASHWQSSVSRKFPN